MASALIECDSLISSCCQLVWIQPEGECGLTASSSAGNRASWKTSSSSPSLSLPRGRFVGCSFAWDILVDVQGQDAEGPRRSRRGKDADRNQAKTPPEAHRHAGTQASPRLLRLLDLRKPDTQTRTRLYNHGNCPPRVPPPNPLQTLQCSLRSLLLSLPRVRACLFDMDGLLIDSEDIYTTITNQILQEHGKPLLPWSIKAQLQGRPQVEVLSYPPSVLSACTPRCTLNREGPIPPAMLTLRFPLSRPARSSTSGPNCPSRRRNTLRAKPPCSSRSSATRNPCPACASCWTSCCQRNRPIAPSTSRWPPRPTSVITD